ncbi:MAG: S8 family serine peptidase, partial [Gammaproteobacteria bacterium]
NSIRGEEFNYLRGTSMSAPHVAGIAALIKQARPDWSPAAIKSALMTTARQDIVREDETTPADPFDMGAGHIVPNAAINPGLVYETTTDQYDAYLCGRNLPRPGVVCQALLDDNVHSSEPWDLNLPSIAVANLVSSTTVRRTVTNKGASGQYVATVTAPAGIGVTVVPEVISINRGATATFSVIFRNEGAPIDTWAFGDISWQGDGKTVRSPFAVLPAKIFAPEELDGVSTSGELLLPVEFGYDGPYEPVVHGLEPACRLPADEFCNFSGPKRIVDDPDNLYVFSAEPPPSVARFDSELKTNDQAVLRFRLFERFHPDDDLDMYLYFCSDISCTDIELIATSGADNSAEEITVINPDQGFYKVDVHGYELSGASTDVTLYAWAFGLDDNRGNLLLSGAPGTVSYGTKADLTLNWQDLPEDFYLGGVSHNDDIGENHGITIIDIDATVTAP